MSEKKIQKRLNKKLVTLIFSMSVASKELYMVGEGGRELLGVVEGESEGVDKLFNQAYPLSSRGVWKKNYFKN